MKITNALESKLILLLAVYEIGGNGTKKEVLNYIENNSYLLLTEKDKEVLNTRNERKWRNNLAYERDHLVKEGLFERNANNQWKITEDGMSFLVEKCSLISQSDIKNLNRITSHALNSIYKLSSEYDNDFSNREKELLEDLLDMPNERKKLTIERIKRYQKNVNYLKNKYNNRCQFEGCNFTFMQKNNVEYSEAHHLIPLSDNGSQDENNVVILCPNHHRIMHYADVKIYELEDNKRKLLINKIENNIIY